MSASFVLLLAVNLLPIAGVWLGGWDAFVLLVLYWLETLVIGFWTMLQIALEPQRPLYSPDQDAEARKVLGPLHGPLTAVHLKAGGLIKACILSVHAAIFMSVHMMFLWVMFAGEWSARVTDARSFVDQLVIGTGVWLPLALLFAVRGVFTLLGLFLPDLAGRLGAAPDAGNDRTLRAFYARVVTMHITIIAGGWVIIMLGNQKALIAVVAIKIMIDMVLDPLMKSDRGASGGGVRARAR